jgi:hypothetical protein
MKAASDLPECKILREGKTPADWVKYLSTHGIEISERSLRKKANRAGACYRISRTMWITHQQINLIFEEGKQWHSKFSNEMTAKTTGSRVGLSSKGRELRGHTGAAHAHLQRLAHKTG